MQRALCSPEPAVNAPKDPRKHLAPCRHRRRCLASRLLMLAVSLGAAGGASPSQALPIGFGVTQGGLDYSERKSDHFYVYHDARVPSEGAAILNALEAARPYLEQWFRQQRERPLPVIMSAVTANASFANFLTDAIELQTMGQGGRDLAWHEYTHSTMYRAFDNVFGPAGNILHLPWMPAWFLEGLAESMAVSVGSDVTAGIERYQALANDWPTYARLHSLYSNANFAERGYATSGAMVSYLLRSGDADKFPRFLADFYHYSMPWWWPWTLVPFNGFLPFDATLENYLGKNGADFYEDYKRAATAFWRSRGQAPLLVAGAAKAGAMAFTTGLSFHSDGSGLRVIRREDGDAWEETLRFDAKNGWAVGVDKQKKLGDGFDSLAGFSGATKTPAPATAFFGRVRYGENPKELASTIAIRKDAPPTTDRVGPATPQALITRPASVYGLWQSKDQIIWFEQAQAQTRLCTTAKSQLFGTSAPAIKCPISRTIPQQIQVLGARPLRAGTDAVSELWLAEVDEKLAGTQYQVRIWNPSRPQPDPPLLRTVGRPIAAAFAGQDTWLLLGERNERRLRRYDRSGRCLGMLQVKDHLLGASGLSDGSLILTLYAGENAYVQRLPKEHRRETACTPVDGPISPLQFAVASRDPGMDLKTAVAGASLWVKNPQPLSAAAAQRLDAEPAADREVAAGSHTDTQPSPAKWRGRPLFIFPWIGAEDALGYQLGAITVPLMDNLQNETLRLSMLYGVNSHFPYQELTLTTTRFYPVIDLTVYREQSYNGRFLRRADNTIVNGYFDEKGVRIASARSFQQLGGTLSLGLGMKYANLKPYLGPTNVRHGNLIEPAGSLELGHGIGSWSFSNGINGRVAPRAVNTEFDYQEVGAHSTISLALPFWSSRSSVGVEGSRTMGSKRHELEEMYVPLKTFIPGNGGGYNQNSFPLGAADTGLFAPSFGEAQGRAKVDWTVPVLHDVDKLFWIIYMERLDFTAFYNYGGAWTGAKPAAGWEHLTRAHGYRLDLQMENKGVRFNVGLGVGQVVGRPFESYVNTGFDALF